MYILKLRREKGKTKKHMVCLAIVFDSSFVFFMIKKNKEYNTLITKNYFLFYIFLLLRIETRCFEKFFLVISAVFI